MAPHARLVGYSPLDQIDRSDVRHLALVWSRGLTAGIQEGTPLVHDGVMFMPNPLDVVHAVDAASGSECDREETGATVIRPMTEPRTRRGFLEALITGAARADEVVVAMPTRDFDTRIGVANPEAFVRQAYGGVLAARTTR